MGGPKPRTPTWPNGRPEPRGVSDSAPREGTLGVIWAYFLAVAAATVNAASNVLQRLANRNEPPQLSMRLALIVDLVQRPVWLAGFGAVLVSFVLTAAALDRGALAVVQPILVLELPLTLFIASRTMGARLHVREWGAAVAMVVGLGGLLLALSPGGGTGAHASGVRWLVAGAGTAGVAAAAVAVGVTGKGLRRAAFLGIAGGIMFGLTAAFMKGMTGALSHGFGHIFVVWQTYLMAASGAAALFLAQNALQAGRLLVAQPGITLCDPAVGMLWGILVFQESTRGGLALVGAVLSGVVLVAGVVLLMHSPLLADTVGNQQQSTGPDDSQPPGDDVPRQRHGTRRAAHDGTGPDRPADGVAPAGLGAGCRGGAVGGQRPGRRGPGSPP